MQDQTPIPVYLPTVDDSTQDYNQGEPQMVKAIVPNRSQVHITSRARGPGQSVTNFSLPIQPFIGSARRVQIADFTGYLSIPNVNIRNNQITFELGTTPGVLRTATLPPGFYNEVDYATALGVEMNAPTPALPGLIAFVVVWNPIIRTIIITCVGDTFSLEVSNLQTRGIYFAQFPALSVQAIQQSLTNVTFIYSPRYYVDIPEIRKNAKLSSVIAGNEGAPYSFSIDMGPNPSPYVALRSVGAEFAPSYYVDQRERIIQLSIRVYDVFLENPNLYMLASTTDHLDIDLVMIF